MKYYFQTQDSDHCWNKEYYKDYMIENGLKEIQVYPAKAEYHVDYFWCSKYDEVGEVGESCQFCGGYTPRNGKNGICKHYRPCRHPKDEPIILKLKI